MIILLLKQAFALVGGLILFTIVNRAVRYAILRKTSAPHPFLEWVLTGALILFLAPPTLIFGKTIAKNIFHRNQFFFLIAGIFFWSIYVGFNLYTLLLTRKELLRKKKGNAGLIPFPSLVFMLALTMGTFLASSYGMFVEPFLLEIVEREVPLKRFPQDGNTLRIVVVADLQTAFRGPLEERLPDLVKGLNPHIILLAGDYAVRGGEQSSQVFSARSVLSRLEAPLGIYAVSSDAETIEQRRRILEGLPISYLKNENRKIEVGGKEIYIVGLLNHHPNPDQAFQGIPRDAFRILLLHNPDRIRLVSPHRVDFAVAGHTHGGQIRAPFLGPLVTFSDLGRKYADGLTDYRGIPLYISRGIGLEGGFAPRLRFLCRPELTLLELRRGE